jgi:hypothetical protein
VADGVIAIEWPDRLTHRLEGAIGVELTTTGESTRRISVGGR